MRSEYSDYEVDFTFTIPTVGSGNIRVIITDVSAVDAVRSAEHKFSELVKAKILSATARPYSDPTGGW